MSTDIGRQPISYFDPFVATQRQSRYWRKGQGCALQSDNEVQDRDGSRAQDEALRRV